MVYSCAIYVYKKIAGKAKDITDSSMTNVIEFFKLKKKTKCSPSRLDYNSSAKI